MFNGQRFSALLEGQASSWPADFVELGWKRLKSRCCVCRQDSTAEQHTESGGEGGIRTPGTSFSSYNGLANRRLQPLGHLSSVWFPHLSTSALVNLVHSWCTDFH